MLAIDGGPKSVIGPIPRFSTIGASELIAMGDTLVYGSLSGFLGGELRGGPRVQKLEETWADVFKVKHAIACNSATSGLLLACMAVKVGPDSIVRVSPYTMSATAAVPKFLNAYVAFDDIESETFGLDPWSSEGVDVTIITNLFGHPARLAEMRLLVDQEKGILIEDNAQAIFAKEGDKYAGTIGHIGVFSLNVHKHLQCGEGGICVTDDDALAHRIRLGLNHSELAGGSVGLNLRMTEVTAAIALEQLYKADKIMSERREIAETIIDAAGYFLPRPVVRKGCTHSYYMIPWLTEYPVARDAMVAALQAEGVPVRAGYTQPLYSLPAFTNNGKWTVIPNVEEIECSIITYENCAWTPTSEQLKQFKEAFRKVGDRYVVPTRDAGTDSGDAREITGSPI